MQKLKLTKKYEAYPEYKDSGVEWLGRVPKDWAVEKNKTAFSFKKEIVGVRKNDYKILSLTLNGVIPRDMDNNMGKFPADYATYQIVKPDDLVMCLFDMDVTPRTVGYVDKTGLLTSAYRVFLPKNNIYTKYYYYYQIMLDNTKELLHFTGGLRNSISKEFFLNLDIPKPCLLEQEKIAKFLDNKTSFIEQIIDKKNKQIELLKEKQNTFINHLTIKGAESENIHLVESNINNFGKIPKNWNIQKMKFLAKRPFQYGANEAGLDDDITQPRFIRITDIDENGGLRKDIFKSIDIKIAKPYLLEDGDILFARTGGTVGKTFKYKKEFGLCCYAGYLIRMSVNQKKISSDYLEYITKSDYYWKWIDSIFIRSTIQNVSAEKYKDFLIALPPLEEQKKIISILNNKIPTFEKSIESVKKSISFLQEFKLSLISNVVTGKIKI